ncbi:MAG: hypothetical protein JRC89_12650 [Deltaproteobacteria bacterium]|nr:hypothetical protein [Deltaproteobacteria bacterium]
MFVLLHQIPEESDEKQFAFGEEKAANVLTAKNVELYSREIHQIDVLISAIADSSFFCSSGTKE